MRGQPKSADAGSQPSEEICFAVNLLRSLLERSQEQDFFDVDERASSQMVYTNGVTLWLLILQRLGGGKTLQETVSHLLAHEMDLLPENRRVREGKLSENTSTYSRARKRLSLDFIHRVSHEICAHLGKLAPPFFEGRRAFILDGTTITLPPTPALRQAFPPASNQHGASAWPVAQLVLASELQSGCVLLPQIDPMYGDDNASEAEQARRILPQLPDHSIVLADGGFGIYSVAYWALKAGHDFIFRLTCTRFKALWRRAELIDEGPGYKTYHLNWLPSGKDLRTNPGLATNEPLDVVLHEVDIGADEPLYLVSSLELHAQAAAEIYRRRYDVEFDIRDVKVTLDIENIRARSVDMVLKELYTSIVAYNLVAQFRRQAAYVAKLKPRRLSFKGVWTTFKERLLLKRPCSVEQWLEHYDDALHRAAKRKLPNRPRPRSYPRQAHPRRQKSTKFQKEQRRKKTTEIPDPPRK